MPNTIRPHWYPTQDSSAYHPQCNGLVECYNQTIQRSLIKLVNEKQNNWDMFLMGSCLFISHLLLCSAYLGMIQRSPQKQIVLKYQPVQRQRSSNGCGFFALATATTLCSGSSPSTVVNNQQFIQNNLLDCLMNHVPFYTATAIQTSYF